MAPGSSARTSAALLPSLLALALGGGSGGGGHSPHSQLLADLDTKGYHVIRGAFGPEQAARARTALGSWRREAVWQRRSERIGQILELDSVFGELIDALPEGVQAAAHQHLGGSGYYFGSYHVLVLHPEDHKLNDTDRDRVFSANLHSDYPYGHATEYFGKVEEDRGDCAAGGQEDSSSECAAAGGGERPRRSNTIPANFPPTVQVQWMLTDMTSTNGATFMLPGSHHTREVPERSHDDDYKRFKAGAVQMTGQEGDIMVYIGQCWHTIGLNEADAPRVALLGQLLPYFARPMESHSWTTSMGTAAGLTQKARRLLGLPWDAFFGHSSRLPPAIGLRGPVVAAGLLWDILVHGSVPPVHPKLLASVARDELKSWSGLFGSGGELPQWQQDAVFALLVHGVFQAQRWLTLLALLVIPLAAGGFCGWCCCRRRVGQHGGTAVLCLLSLLLGVVLGISLAMERVRL